MDVRERVFVNEQHAVPIQHHMDRDDARSCHWVLYSTTSSEEQRPIGTIRLVPYPHYPHPMPGARFEAPSDEVPFDSPEDRFSAPLPKLAVDRATDLHDGIEPYVKLGRLCVLKEFRGKRYADVLIQTALSWAREHSQFFMQNLTSDKTLDTPEWKGLVCIHAHIKAVGTWRRNGFAVDEGMGNWFEGGMEHVGMFCRLDLSAK